MPSQEGADLEVGEGAGIGPFDYPLCFLRRAQVSLG